MTTRNTVRFSGPATDRPPRAGAPLPPASLGRRREPDMRAGPCDTPAPVSPCGTSACPCTRDRPVSPACERPSVSTPLGRSQPGSAQHPLEQLVLLRRSEPGADGNVPEPGTGELPAFYGILFRHEHRQPIGEFQIAL